jgi:LacI family repressor for deo operon, udp, cdd, tsx, nupC, and nupG
MLGQAVDTIYGINVSGIFFCVNDEMAVGAIRGIKASGRRIPEDVSVVGFDDIRFARYIDPPLTTIAQPKNELGREAMRMLLEILDGADTPTPGALSKVSPVVLVRTSPPN